MTNPTPHGQVPEALLLVEEISNLMCSSEAAAKTIAAAADELCRLHVENAYLRASPTPPAEQQAASSAVLKAIREANMQLVRTGDDAFMLVPYKVATTEAAAPKAGVTTGAALGGVYAELPAPLLIQYDEIDCEEFGCFAEGQMRDFADRTHALRVESLAAAYCEELDRLSQRNYELRLASHGQALRLLTQKEKDSLGRRAEGMDGNEWDQWGQEKFAQVNGLKVQGGSYEWDCE